MYNLIAYIIQMKSISHIILNKLYTISRHLSEALISRNLFILTCDGIQNSMTKTILSL